MPGVPPDTTAYYGHIETTGDALRVVYAARQGRIPRITRRLNESERKRMIRSGNVFVFSVEESGIKRWTDGRMWSPSRIVGNFLVYREMNERGLSRVRGRHSMDDGSMESSGIDSLHSPPEPPTFKPDGLLKKTITITINGSDLHLIAYFTQTEVNSGSLRRPTSNPLIMQLVLPAQLFQLSNLRNPPKITTGTDGKTKIDDEADQELVLSTGRDRQRRSWEEERTPHSFHTLRRSTISGTDGQLELPSSYYHRTPLTVSQGYSPYASASSPTITAPQRDSGTQERYQPRPMVASTSSSLSPAAWNTPPTPSWPQRGAFGVAGYEENRADRVQPLDDPSRASRWHQMSPTLPSPWSDYSLRSASSNQEPPQLLGPPQSPQVQLQQYQHSIPPSPSNYNFDYSSLHGPYAPVPLPNVRPRESSSIKMENSQGPELFTSQAFQPTPSYTLARATEMERDRGSQMGR